MPRVLLVSEFAKEARLHPETVRDWLRTGRIRGTRVGSSWRIPAEEIDRVLGLSQEKQPAV